MLAQCVKTTPILSKIRKFDGYTVQNFALETLPGLYICGSIYTPQSKGKHALIICPNGHFGGCLLYTSKIFLCSSVRNITLKKCIIIVGGHCVSISKRLLLACLLYTSKSVEFQQSLSGQFHGSDDFLRYISYIT